jgi:hypothetical protein
MLRLSAAGEELCAWVSMRAELYRFVVKVGVGRTARASCRAGGKAC